MEFGNMVQSEEEYVAPMADVLDITIKLPIVTSYLENPGEENGEW